MAEEHPYLIHIVSILGVMSGLATSLLFRSNQSLNMSYMFSLALVRFSALYHRSSRPCSIGRRIIRMRSVFRPYRALQHRILILPIDIFQDLRIHIISIEPHLILSSVTRGWPKRPPIASARHESPNLVEEIASLTRIHNYRRS